MRKSRIHIVPCVGYEVKIGNEVIAYFLTKKEAKDYIKQVWSDYELR